MGAAQVAGATIRTRLGEALRDTALTALVALGVFLPLVGFETITDINNALILTTRWPLLFALVGSVAAIRFIYALILAPRLERSALRLAPRASATAASILRNWFIPFAVAFVIVYPMLVVLAVGFGGAVRWIDNFGIQILIYVMLGWGLNIVVGLAGENLWPVILDSVAACRNAGIVLGYPARLPGAAAARRLSGYRHTRLRRDYPPHLDQLGAGDQRLCRNRFDPSPNLIRHSLQCRG